MQLFFWLRHLWLCILEISKLTTKYLFIITKSVIMKCKSSYLFFLLFVSALFIACDNENSHCRTLSHSNK